MILFAGSRGAWAQSTTTTTEPPSTTTTTTAGPGPVEPTDEQVYGANAAAVFLFFSLGLLSGKAVFR